MDEQLDQAPCGFITLTKSGTLLSVNQTLCDLLGFSKEQLIGKHINFILAESVQAFMQLYFFPLITMQHQVDEMYISLATEQNEKIPVMMNASLNQDADSNEITCVLIPMQKRDEYENQLLIAKKIAEDALKEKSTANSFLEKTLTALEEKQLKLQEANKQNEQYKTDTQIELNLAKKVQENSLTEGISNDLIEMETYYRASGELSGDIYGAYQINDHQYGVILLDVMGRGISSALINMSLQSLFHRLITRGVAANTVMKELDNYLHTLFHNNQDAWHYCTAIYLIIDTDKQIIECTNAGHPPAIFQSPSKDQKELLATSPPIGTFDGLDFHVDTFRYDNGSRILLYTDGVSEPLGEEHLQSLLTDNASSSLGELKTTFLSSIQEVGEDKFKDDDQCFILIDLK